MLDLQYTLFIFFVIFLFLNNVFHWVWISPLLYLNQLLKDVKLQVFLHRTQVLKENPIVQSITLSSYHLLKNSFLNFQSFSE